MVGANPGYFHEGFYMENMAEDQCRVTQLFKVSPEGLITLVGIISHQQFQRFGGVIGLEDVRIMPAVCIFWPGLQSQSCYQTAVHTLL